MTHTNKGQLLNRGSWSRTGVYTISVCLIILQLIVWSFVCILRMTELRTHKCNTCFPLTNWKRGPWAIYQVCRHFVYFIFYFFIFISLEHVKLFDWLLKSHKPSNSKKYFRQQFVDMFTICSNLSVNFLVKIRRLQYTSSKEPNKKWANKH